MSTPFAVDRESQTQPDRNAWIKIGLATAVSSIVAVLVVQMVAISIWPEVALFKPLDSYGRTAVFVLVPVVIATALFAWLVANKEQPVQRFMKIAAVVLILSFIPDYILPVSHKTVLASSVTAFLHVVAAAVTVAVLVAGYRRFLSEK